VTPDRLRECLALLRWSQRGLAEALDCDERQIRRWAAGAAVPPAVAAWLDRLAAYHERHPPPGR
jgi:transcriptional regulator with XRE-family HTH domain